MKYSISKKQILSASHNDDGVDIAAGVAAMPPTTTKPGLPVVSPDRGGDPLEEDSPGDSSTAEE